MGYELGLKFMLNVWWGSVWSWEIKERSNGLVNELNATEEQTIL